MMHGKEGTLNPPTASGMELPPMIHGPHPLTMMMTTHPPGRLLLMTAGATDTSIPPTTDGTEMVATTRIPGLTMAGPRLSPMTMTPPPPRLESPASLAEAPARVASLAEAPARVARAVDPPALALMTTMIFPMDGLTMDGPHPLPMMTNHPPPTPESLASPADPEAASPARAADRPRMMTMMKPPLPGPLPPMMTHGQLPSKMPGLHPPMMMPGLPLPRKMTAGPRPSLMMMMPPPQESLTSLGEVLESLARAADIAVVVPRTMTTRSRLKMPGRLPQNHRRLRNPPLRRLTLASPARAPGLLRRRHLLLKTMAGRDRFPRPTAIRHSLRALYSTTTLA